jgi:hypothetical protein
MYIVIEINLEDNRRSYWGPFNTHKKACIFAHDRIELLAKEWGEDRTRYDGFLLDHLNWAIVSVNSV